MEIIKINKIVFLVLSQMQTFSFECGPPHDTAFDEQKQFMPIFVKYGPPYFVEKQHPGIIDQIFPQMSYLFEE